MIKRKGFTMLEVLTAVIVIAILIAIALPAFDNAKDYALNMKQKAQFAALDTALESYRADFGAYPESERTDKDDGGSGDGLWYTGAHKLAEAVVGYDAFGVHKDTLFSADGKDASGTLLYDITASGNKAARRGPYVEPAKIGAVEPDAIYSIDDLNDGDIESTGVVISDSFDLAKNRKTGKIGSKVGLPILYYKADTTKVEYGIPAGPGDVADYVYDVYNRADGAPIWNGSFINIEPPFDTNAKWYMTTFYEMTVNPNFTVNRKPYNSDTFILQSAGPDGIYCTKDDVFNFDQD